MQCSLKVYKGHQSHQHFQQRENAWKIIMSDKQNLFTKLDLKITGKVYGKGQQYNFII